MNEDGLVEKGKKNERKKLINIKWAVSLPGESTQPPQVPKRRRVVEKLTILIVSICFAPGRRPPRPAICKKYLSPFVSRSRGEIFVTFI